MSDADRMTRAIEAMTARLDGVGMVDVDEDPALAEGFARHLLTCGGCDKLIQPGGMACDECFRVLAEGTADEIRDLAGEEAEIPEDASDDEVQAFGRFKALHAVRGRQVGAAIMREVKEIERGEAPAHDEPFGGQPELARMLIAQLDSV